MRVIIIIIIIIEVCLALERGDAQITAHSKWVCARNAHCWSFPINCQISLWQLNTHFRHVLKFRHARPSSDFIPLNHLLHWARGRRQQPQIQIKLLSGRITGHGARLGKCSYNLRTSGRTLLLECFKNYRSWQAFCFFFFFNLCRALKLNFKYQWKTE